MVESRASKAKSALSRITLQTDGLTPVSLQGYGKPESCFAFPRFFRLAIALTAGFDLSRGVMGSCWFNGSYDPDRLVVGLL